MPWWVVASPLVLLALVLWLRGQNRRENDMALEGQRAMYDGDLERAVAIFERMPKTIFSGGLLARARMRMGRLQDAIDLYLEQHAWASRHWYAESSRLFAAIEVATLFALRGKLDDARRWTAEARRWLPRSRGINRKSANARLLVIDVVTLCRDGQVEDAWSALEREWHTFEVAHGGWLAEACLLRGYIADATGRDVEPWLGLVDERAITHVVWMASEWPELRAFCAKYELRS